MLNIVFNVISGETGVLGWVYLTDDQCNSFNIKISMKLYTTTLTEIGSNVNIVIKHSSQSATYDSNKISSINGIIQGSSSSNLIRLKFIYTDHVPRFSVLVIDPKIKYCEYYYSTS